LNGGPKAPKTNLEKSPSSDNKPKDQRKESNKKTNKFSKALDIIKQIKNNDEEDNLGKTGSSSKIDIGESVMILSS